MIKESVQDGHPTSLKSDQRHERIEVCQGLWVRYFIEENAFFFSFSFCRVVTADESCFHYYQSESKQSKRPGSSATIKLLSKKSRLEKFYIRFSTIIIESI